MNPDLSTPAARVLYAARVLQEARQQDEQFATVYHESLNHHGVGLGSILADLSRRLAAQ